MKRFSVGFLLLLLLLVLALGATASSAQSAGASAPAPAQLSISLGGENGSPDLGVSDVFEAQKKPRDAASFSAVGRAWCPRLESGREDRVRYPSSHYYST